MHNFKDLKVWQKSVDLAVVIYHITSAFPSEEKFGLVSQMRRASISVSSNIAEGCAKSSKKSFSNSLEISLGECFELEAQTEICKRIGLIAEDSYIQITTAANEIQKMIMGLKYSLEKNS
ncbi:MAG TPA: four helix bundle protein [Cyclobacteriaceae bacterium]|nr:four helix bundle protein [Cyclobacteriaceae bacterium]